MGARTSFYDNEMRAFEPAEKIALVASVSPEGLPHISLLTTLEAIAPSRMILGEFCAGLSKEYIRNNPKVAFLIMTLDRHLWRGTARWTHCAQDGPEYERINNKPMFRFNTYFGVNTVHYFNLVATYGREPLPLSRIIPAALLTRIAAGGAGTGKRGEVLAPFAVKMVNQLDTLKFISYVGNDGFPVLFPVIQSRAADSRRVIFSPLAYGDELTSMPVGKTVAVFVMTMGLEDFLVRGTFLGYERHRLARVGIVDIHWVYNSMPPVPGQVYPKDELTPVVEFS
jgi:hypothetical protein